MFFLPADSAAPDTAFISHRMAAQACAFDSLFVSPIGDRVALGSSARFEGLRWSLRYGSVFLLGEDCLADETVSCTPLEVGAVTGVSSPQWFGDGTGLNVLVGDAKTVPSRVVPIDWQMGRGQPALGRAAGFEGVQASLALRGYIPKQSAVEYVRSLERALASAVVPQNRTLSITIKQGKFSGAIYEAKPELDLLAWRRGGNISRFAISTAQVRHPYFEEMGDGESMVVDGGAFYSASSRLNSGPLATGVFREAETGQVLGTAYGRSLASSDKSVRLGRLNRYLEKERGFFIRDAAYLRASKQTVVLLQDALGQSRIISQRGSLVKRGTLLCAHGENSPSPQIEFKNWGSRSRPLPTWLFRQEKSERLVVLIHGGPDEAAIGRPLSQIARLYLTKGFDVALIEYSGTVGLNSGLTLRLSGHPEKEANADAVEIGHRLKALRATYANIVIHAESYGAIYAMAPEVAPYADATVLVAPWFEYRPPTLWRFPVPSAQRLEYQTQFERRTFGWTRSADTERTASWLKARTQKWAAIHPVLIVASDRDDIAPYDRIAESLIRPNVQLVRIANLPHSAMSNNEDTRSAIEAFIQGRLD